LPFTCFFSFNFVTCKNNSYINMGILLKIQFSSQNNCGLRFLTTI
jgi:hypothetical protein